MTSTDAFHVSSFGEAFALHQPSVQDLPRSTTAVEGGNIRWSWACRVSSLNHVQLLSRAEAGAPEAGHLALVRVEEIGSHERITTRDNQRLRIYPGDLIVGVFGNRYATDAYEGEVMDTQDLGILTAGGMIGTVLSRHRSVARPTRVRFLGYLANNDGAVANLKDEAFRAARPQMQPRNLVAVIGTGMNAGKTTSCVKLIRALGQLKQRVAACKLTGSVSNRDQDEMRSASAVQVLDFSDFGFPSTYLSDKPELMTLFDSIMAGLEPSAPEITIMEIADGILQRETTMLLEDPTLRASLSGVVLAADNALAARYAVDRLRQWGHHVIAVTGLITSSPLCVREFEAICDVPVAASTGDGEQLGSAVLAYLRKQHADTSVAKAERHAA
ncbi:MAG: hypothetical protein MUF01_09740 [Bryobacterales bacterium]|jgi:hypothetical protein|nr:hypothetical protein [Bryobacterales bacterium]